MAIQKLNRVKTGEGHYDYRMDPEGEPTHVGLVVARDTRCERIMSDVWSNCYYATVWNPEAGEPETISLGTSEFGCHKKAGIDAPPDVMAAYKAWLDAKSEAQQKAREAKEAAERKARKDAEQKAPAKGRIVRVVKGRKVPVGTTGQVFWTGNGDWGPRLGIATTDRRDPKTGNFADVVWTAASNCEALPEGNTDEDVKARLETGKTAWLAAREATEEKRVDAAVEEVPF